MNWYHEWLAQEPMDSPDDWMIERVDDYLDEDDGYREWSETIEKLNQEMQELEDYMRPDSLITLEELEQCSRQEREANRMGVIDLSGLSWDQVIDKLTPGNK